MGTPAAEIGNICMIPVENGIDRKVEVQLDFCIINRGPYFSGITDEGFEEWILEVDLDGSSSPMSVLNLTQPQGLTSIVGIEFIVLLAGTVLKKKKRGYMAAVPCG